MAWNGSTASMEAFVERHGLTFPNLRDETGDLFARFEVPYQPAWVFVAADGTAARVSGALGEEDLDERLASLASA